MDYVYNMTWAEFRLRLFAYKRQQKRLDYRQRDIMYQIYVSNWGDPKKKPATKNQYWKLDDAPIEKYKGMAEVLRKANENYKKEKIAKGSWKN